MDHQPAAGPPEPSPAVTPESNSTHPFPAGQDRNSVLPAYLKALVILGFSLYTVLFGYHAYRLLAFPYDIDNSEGFLLFGGHRLATGQGLYGDLTSPPHLVDNYPPVYPVLLAVGDRLVGTKFIWGRSLSVAATLGIAVLIYLWIGGVSGRRWSAFLSALCFLSFYHVYDWGALARVDMVAIFLSVLGLVFVERGKSIVLPVTCFVLSLCTKQTMFAGPLAAVMFLQYREERRSAAALLISVAVLTGLLYALFQLLSGGAFLRHVFVYNSNPYRLLDLFIYFRHWWATYPILGGIGLFFFLHRWKNRQRDLIFYFLFFSSLSALFCGKIGSAPNYLLEMVVATCLALGLVMAEVDVAERKDRSVLNLLLPVLLLAQILATMHWPHAMDFSYTPTTSDLYDARNVERILRKSPGPILSERAGLPLLAGHDPFFQPFICTQLARQGLWDEQPLLERIKRHEFPLILLTWDLFEKPADPERFSAEFVSAVADSYEIDQSFRKLVLYRPKRSSPHSSSNNPDPSKTTRLKADTIMEATNTHLIPEVINGATAISIRTTP
ncbi:MAG: hypothetical protein ABIH23_04920 [bacterium]